MMYEKAKGVTIISTGMDQHHIQMSFLSDCSCCRHIRIWLL